MQACFLLIDTLCRAFSAALTVQPEWMLCLTCLMSHAAQILNRGFKAVLSQEQANNSHLIDDAYDSA